MKGLSLLLNLEWALETGNLQGAFLCGSKNVPYFIKAETSYV